MDLCFCHSLDQLIVEPTRTTERINTLIDHILTNSPEKGYLEWHYSDGINRL